MTLRLGSIPLLLSSLNNTFFMVCHSTNYFDYHVDSKTLNILTHTANTLEIMNVSFPSEHGFIVAESTRDGVLDDLQATEGVIENITHIDSAAEVDGEVALLENERSSVMGRAD